MYKIHKSISIHRLLSENYTNQKNMFAFLFTLLAIEQVNGQATSDDYSCGNEKLQLNIGIAVDQHLLKTVAGGDTNVMEEKVQSKIINKVNSVMEKDLGIRLNVDAYWWSDSNADVLRGDSSCSQFNGMQEGLLTKWNLYLENHEKQRKFDKSCVTTRHCTKRTGSWNLITSCKFSSSNGWGESESLGAAPVKAICLHSDKITNGGVGAVVTWDLEDDDQTWKVFLHEMGHMLGANHSKSGIMTKDLHEEIRFSRTSKEEVCVHCQRLLTSENAHYASENCFFKVVDSDEKQDLSRQKRHNHLDEPVDNSLSQTKSINHLRGPVDNRNQNNNNGSCREDLIHIAGDRFHYDFWHCKELLVGQTCYAKGNKSSVTCKDNENVQINDKSKGWGDQTGQVAQPQLSTSNSGSQTNYVWSTRYVVSRQSNYVVSATPSSACAFPSSDGLKESARKLAVSARKLAVSYNMPEKNVDIFVQKVLELAKKLQNMEIRKRKLSNMLSQPCKLRGKRSIALEKQMRPKNKYEELEEVVSRMTERKKLPESAKISTSRRMLTELLQNHVSI